MPTSSLRRMRKIAGPVSVLTLVSFLSTFVPRSALAQEERKADDADLVRARETDVGLARVGAPGEAPTASAGPNASRAQGVGVQVPREPGGEGREPPSSALTSNALQAVGGRFEATNVALPAAPATPSTDPGGSGSSVTKRGPAGPQLSLPQGAGKLRGMGESFSAQLSTGIARYEIRFELPSARGGAQPSLALAYSSSGGHGLAGVGWGVGAPTITRQIDRGLPRYQDPAPGGPWHPEQDRFVSGADELVPICLVSGTTCTGAQTGEVMPAWASGWQYFRARVEGAFLRYFWSPDHRTWRVQSKNGVSMELGVPLDGSSDTSALEVDPSAPSRIYAWHVVRMYDAMGEANPSGAQTPLPLNLVRYRYETVSGTSYLTDLYDTPPAANAATAPVSSYAHHAHLRYEARPDVATSYRRGWRADVTRRLQGVDVTSYDFAATSRELLRRYHLSYDANAHVSLLTRVQMEGRCGEPVPESGTDGLLPPTSCPRTPGLTFDYQRVAPFRVDGSAASADVPGYEGFDERIHTIAASPPHSIHEALTDLADIDSDGLPDVLVTDPVRYGHGHGVFFNKGFTFAPAAIMAVEGVLGADANVIRFSNPNLSSHDVDGDGTVNLLHMPFVKTYSVYAPRRRLDGTWAWQGREVTTASQQSAKIDFAGRNENIRLMDVNADGLIDVAYTAGTEVHTFLSLGRYPGGDGQYGDATWTGPTSASISNEPLRSCIPWSALPVRFGDPDVRVADMNGDGFPDIARIRHGDIRYWPGRGNGFWGTGDPAGCPAGTFGQDQHVAMANSPQIGMFGDDPSLLEDVNGDGLADFLKVRFNAIDIYLNVDGVGWTERHVIANAPPNSSITNRVRLTDVNGSGTPDILWGDGHDYKFIDLAGGARPWVLTRVNNGLGATTEIEYASSVELMLAAAASGQPWETTAPAVAHVVKRVTERDNLELVGRPAGAHVTEYTYRDPVYEGRQRDFRGFRSVRVKRLGDVNNPTTIAESHFLLGECVDEPGDPARCDVADRWRDNRREALKGQPVLTEAFDESGAYLSTEHTTYGLRELYTGLDGRAVRHAFVSSTDSYGYDTGPFTPASSSVSLSDVVLERSAGVLEPEPPRSVALRSTAGRAHLRSSVEVDRFGNAVNATKYGCVDGCASVDEPIVVHTTPTRIATDPSGWIFRTTEQWVQGASSPTLLRRVVSNFDAHGRITSEGVNLTGTLPLARFHEVPGKSVAPTLASAVTDGQYETRAVVYDEFGNPTSVTTPAGHCSDTMFDSAFAQLPVEATVHTGYVPPGSSSCGTYTLTSSLAYDRGLEMSTQSTGAGGEVSVTVYDGFGRVVAMHLPDPEAGWAPSAVPSARYEYYLADVTTPYSKVRTLLQDGATPAVSSFVESWDYVDGLGRGLVTITQADPTAGDAGAWIASGRTDLDAKGAAYRAYRNAFFTGDPAAFPLAAAPATAFTRVRRDAFGRAEETYGLDGATTMRTVHHAMSTDSWDAADLDVTGPHYNTPTTARVDGHGRTVSVIERAHAGAQIEAHETATTYRATGEPAVILRTGPGISVVRWMRYDSFGRMVLNAEPNTTKDFNPDPATSPDAMKAWRYAYDRLGQLVGTSDARGCGSNHYYLADGRPLGEDYSPCKAEHADYVAPDMSLDAGAAWPVFVKGDGLESLFRYDATDPDASNVEGFPTGPATLGSNAGRMTAISTRGSKTILHYDDRGRPTVAARTMAKPGMPAYLLAQRYAPHWYAKASAYDGPGRPTAESTGADVTELLGTGSASAVTTSYSKRGGVASVGGSYGTLVSSVTHNADGLKEQIAYGDVAQTSTVFTYDVRQRLASAMTYRGPPALWTATPPAYTPAPDPGAGPSVYQTVLEHYAFAYDAVDNPTQISDLRDPAAWPASFKPSTRQLQYDDLYRLKRVDYAGNDDWVSPYDAENGDVTGQRTRPSPHVSFAKRVSWQTHAYDAVGNTTSSNDDAAGFYDRSLGTITNGTASAGPYQLKAAAQASGTRAGELTAAYDDTGNLVSMATRRDGPCLPTGALCSQRYAYEWDEVGHLARARRWDLATAGLATDPLPGGAAAAELRYTYSGGERVLKTAVDSSANELHTVYVFGSLEVRRAHFTGGDYERTAATEVPYLLGPGVRARVYYAANDVPTLSSGHLHVLFELPDHLGSASFVVDKDTSELVEATRYEAYGSVESDYRPERWAAYRSDYRFTGKEDDIEVGLAYFGARYYAPALNRWISADPLAVHEPGEADLNLYAYVHGRTYVAVDPNGQLAWFVPILIGAAIGAVAGAGTAALSGASPAGIAVAGVIGLLAGAAGGAAGSWAGPALGPGLSAALGITPEMGGAVAAGGVGSAAASATSYSGGWAYAESQGRGGEYSWAGFGAAIVVGAMMGAAMGASFEFVFGKAPSPTAQQAGKQAEPEAPLLAPDPPEPVSPPRISEVKTIGSTPAAEPLTQAEPWGKAPCVSNVGGCGGKGMPQPTRPAAPASEPTPLPNSDQGSAPGGPPIKAGASGGPTAGQRFPQAVREEAFRENPTKTCVYCRREGTGTQVDHATARARGGNATIDNAQLACPHCNPSKGAGQFPKTPPPGYEGPWPPPHWKK